MTPRTGTTSTTGPTGPGAPDLAAVARIRELEDALAERVARARLSRDALRRAEGEAQSVEQASRAATDREVAALRDALLAEAYRDAARHLAQAEDRRRRRTAAAAAAREESVDLVLRHVLPAAPEGPR